MGFFGTPPSFLFFMRNLFQKIKKSKHSKLLLKLYIVWCVIADLTLLSGIIWSFIYFW